MPKVGVQEMSGIFCEMKNADKELEGGVLAHLERMGEHRFALLRAWPKWKTLKKVWCETRAGEEREDDVNKNNGECVADAEHERDPRGGMYCLARCRLLEPTKSPRRSSIPDATGAREGTTNPPQ